MLFNWIDMAVSWNLALSTHLLKASSDSVKLIMAGNIIKINHVDTHPNVTVGFCNESIICRRMTYDEAKRVIQRELTRSPQKMALSIVEGPGQYPRHYMKLQNNKLIRIALGE